MIQSVIPGRPEVSKVRVASWTQLPPSPEARAQPWGSLAASIPQPTTFSLGDNLTSKLDDAASSRLRSVATYEKFHPQALACSPPTFQPDGQSAQGSSGDDYSSLGAISGEGGIALFRTSRPDVPVLMLSHSSMVRNYQTRASQSLSFEPILKHSVLLASSQGNGLLIWDASGHSLSPLMGRLSVDPDPNTTTAHDLCSVAWKPTDSAHSMIASTTSSSTCLWDLRVALGAISSRPSLRFGLGSNSASIVQVACSHKDECATMDSTGIVRVYDLRILGGAKPRTLSTFTSFHFAGVGLASFRTSSDESYWMTWGLDVPKSDALVKIWSTVGKNDLGDVDRDNYWRMDGLYDRAPQILPSDSLASIHTGVQLAQFTMPYLACARICPAPLENSIVTMGLTKGGGPGWKADLWKFGVGDDAASESTDTFGVEKILSISEESSFDHWKLNSAGSLRCAEMAVSPAPFVISREQGRDVGGADDDREVLLCCMSENGLLTTSVVTEAPQPSILKHSLGTGKRRFSSRSIRYVPNERRGNTLLDAASALRKSIGDTMLGRHALDESRHAYIHRNDSTSPPSPGKNVNKSENKAADGEHNKIYVSPREDGITTPFDMDVGFIPIQIEHTSSGPASVASGDEGSGIEVCLQPSRVTKPVSTDRVPCPRLCGATFSPGIGGLVGFDNGEIHKMWSWYMRNTSNRKLSGLKSLNRVTTHSSYPRRKKDLDDMIAAAKDAQWGENHDNHGTDDGESESSNDDPFEDLSSEDDEDRAPEIQDHSETSNDIYERYFGVRQSATTMAITESSNVTGDGGSSDGAQFPAIATLPQADVSGGMAALDRAPVISSFDGPTSDVLAPVVRIFFDTESIMFNGQTADLAANLLLGDWNSVEETNVFNSHDSEGNLPGVNFDIQSFRGWAPRIFPSDGANRRTLWPEITKSSLQDRTLHSLHSDSVVHLRSKNEVLSLSQIRERDDEAVHGGEYSLRPRGDESMVFLRKLLPSPYQSLMSPPDSHLLPNNLYLTEMKRSVSSHAILQSVGGVFAAKDTQGISSSNTGLIANDKVGVFTMPIEHTVTVPPTSGSLLKRICTYNSNVCAEFGQHEKADTWSILAHAVENQLVNIDGNDSFSDWNGAYIGRELVRNLLRFYETEGDIQMVVSIVCVLKTGQQGRFNHQRLENLLPLEENDKYDLYLQRYAELVFRWGMLTKRVEILKYLSRHLRSADGVSVLYTPTVQNEDLDAIGSYGSTKYGISFGGTCHRCNAEISTSSSNICNNCRDYAVRCALCDNAVRGLYTVCPICGHGGHLNHVMSWFAMETKCPTGCGCECVFSSSSLDSRESPSALLVAPEETELLVAQRRIHVIHVNTGIRKTQYA